MPTNAHQDALAYALKINDVTLLSSLLDTYLAKPETAKVINLNPLLTTAISEGKLKIMILLIDKGAKVELASIEQGKLSDFLKLAVTTAPSDPSAWEAVNWFVSQGVKVDLPLLKLVMANANEEQVLKFINSIPNVNVKDAEGRNILHLAVLAGASRSVLQNLIAKSADIHATTKTDNFSPLDYAVMSNNLEATELFLGNDQNINIDKMLPRAINSGKWEMLLLLIEKGAPVENNVVKNMDLNSALERSFKNAIENKNSETNKSAWDVIRWILNQSSELSYIHQVDENGNTPMHYAVENKQWDIVAQLYNNGADFVGLDKEAATNFLFYAVKTFQWKIVNNLLSKKIDIFVDQNDNFGNTLVHLIAKSGHLDTLNLLMAYSPSPNLNVINNKHQSPVQLISSVYDKVAHWPIMRKLIQSGAEIDKLHEKDKINLLSQSIISNENKEGSHFNNLDIVMSLVAHKADIHTKNDEGKSALELANTPHELDKNSVSHPLISGFLHYAANAKYIDTEAYKEAITATEEILNSLGEYRLQLLDVNNPDEAVKLELVHVDDMIESLEKSHNKGISKIQTLQEFKEKYDDYKNNDLPPQSPFKSIKDKLCQIIEKYFSIFMAKMKGEHYSPDLFEHNKTDDLHNKPTVDKNIDEPKNSEEPKNRES